MYLLNVTLVLLCFLCMFCVKSQENFKNETLNSTIQVTAENITNIKTDVVETITQKVEKNKKNVTVERIIQPMVKSGGDYKKFENFKPSPLLETKYDLNPALAEPKFVSNHKKDFTWNTMVQNKQIKFPEGPKPSVQTVKEYPYPFVLSNDYYNNYYNKYFESTNKKQDDNIGLQPPIIGYIDHGEYQNPQRFPPVENYKGYEEGRYKPDYTDLELQEKPYELESQFPWKKIIKFLTTFVPIGILLSALIPNVISITPINNAQSRSRLDEKVTESESETKSKMQLVYSSKLASDFKKKRCDHRILCELLLGAGYSKNPEENAEHLLETYVEKEEEITEKTEELKRIMVAVSKRNCEQFKCNAFKGRHNNL